MPNLTTHLAAPLLRVGRIAHRYSPGYNPKGFEKEACPVCGWAGKLIMRGVLWPELVLQWKPTPAWANWIDQREGLRCSSCHSNLRSRQLAKCILDAMNRHAKILTELCGAAEFRTQAIAEINSASNLHSFLAQATGLRYLEYGSTKPGVPSEDLLNLTYPDRTFDLIVNSDVLKHVPDMERALAEIYRVLKCGGLYIFSVPVVWKQPQTRRRAEIRKNKLVHLMPPSYHGAECEGRSDFLVFYEFGRDFERTCENSGFSVSVIKDPRNPALITFEACRPA